MKNSFFIFISLIALSHSCIPAKENHCHHNEMNIATFNIRFNNPNDGENAWPNRKEQVKALIRYHDFDIFGTQEGLTGQLRDIAELDEYNYLGAGRDDGKEAGEHSAIFYRTGRFALQDNGDFWLSETPDSPSYGWGAHYRRICTWAKFHDSLSNKVFFVFNSHFDHEVKEARYESSVLLVKKIKDIAGKEPVFCIGDFNATPEKPEISLLLNALKDSRSISLEPPYGPVGTFNGFDWNASLKRRIDYIFVNNQIKILEYAVLTDSYETKYPSDHLPVVVKAVLDKGGSPKLEVGRIGDS